MSSSNSDPRKALIVDELPLAPSKSRRSGRLRSLGLVSVRGSSQPSLKSKLKVDFHYLCADTGLVKENMCKHLVLSTNETTNRLLPFLE